jgi:hypothetical protein
MFIVNETKKKAIKHSLLTSCVNKKLNLKVERLFSIHDTQVSIYLFVHRAAFYINITIMFT